MSVPDELLAVREEHPADEGRRRRRGRWVLLVAVLLLVVPFVVLLAGVAYLGSSITRDAEPIRGAFDIPEEQRPPKLDPAAAGDAALGTTFLIAGTDRRSDALTTGDGAQAPTWLPGAQRSDAIMLVRLTGDGRRAYVVSIPRDSWVNIPGYGMNKVNAAFSFGGPSLSVRTIEQVTRTRVDHLAVIDWNGLIRLVDVLGGVELTFREPVVGRGQVWPAGTRTLSGEEVLDYVGERYALPRGDFDRVERQHNVLRSLGRELMSQGVTADPGRALDLATATSRLVSVDESLTIPRMLRLALGMRALRPDDVTFMTVPTQGVGFEGSQSVVYLDPLAQAGFWKAFRTDRLEQWVADNDARTTPDNVG